MAYTKEKKELLREFPYYYITTKGNILRESSITGVERIKESYLKDNGSRFINLIRRGMSYSRSVAELVADTFIPNPNNYKYLRFKNGKPSDCRVQNIERSSCVANNPEDVGRVSPRRRKILRKSVKGHIKEYSCMYDVLVDGFTRQSVYRAIKTGNLYKKYKWEYANGITTNS